MSEPILSLRNIETFYGPIMAIRGVSLDVHAGTIVTVLGANGAGKTTILKTISGVMDPGKGSVIFEGREIQKTDPDKVTRMGISHVPEGREVFPFLSVAENLQMGAYTRRDAAGIASDIDLVYEYFPRLKERHAQPAGSMSGGEQQMVALGRAVMSAPRILLVDEPSVGLAPILVSRTIDLIHQLKSSLNLTVLMAEQNFHQAVRIADRGYVIVHGRIAFEGDSAAALSDNQMVRDFYLGQ